MNSNLTDLILLFNRLGIRYMVAGGYAVMSYVGPRFTRDLDLAVASTSNDVLKLQDAMAEFGFPIDDAAMREFEKPNRMITIGLPPNRIDIMNELKGLTFEDAYLRRVEGMLGDLPVPMLCLDDLIVTKQASGRPQDLIDLALLKEKRDSGL